MTIQEILQAEGLSADEITTLTSNPKYTSVLDKYRQKSEQGETALLNAKQIEENLNKFNRETVIPYGIEADKKVAKANAELAKTQAYLKSLKESGYDIPDDYMNVAPTPVATPVAAPSGDYSKEILTAAEANMSLISLSNRYRGLTGDELDVDNEYQDFKQNLRPGENLRSYIDRKYDLTAKAAAKTAEKEQKRLDAYAAEKIEKYKAEHPISSDPERSAPRPTKFDRLVNQDADRKQLWQTAEGREKATQDRIKKYSSVQ
jgi:hypothetical protein